MTDSDSKVLDGEKFSFETLESMMVMSITSSEALSSLEIKDQSEVEGYINKLKERIQQMTNSIETITGQSESMGAAGHDSAEKRKEKMMMHTELFNEVHLMCGEVRQIISHIRSFKKFEMSSDNIEKMIKAEEEINSILLKLSRLKCDLHDKISGYMDSADKSDSFPGLKSSDNLSNKSIVDTDYSISNETTDSRSTSENAQIKFISDYMHTLVKNVEEIHNTISSIDPCDSTVEDLKDKINELKVLERHLNRNEPLVKEIEFWLQHDFAKPYGMKTGAPILPLKEQYQHLCDVMSSTNSLLLYKNELLHKELDKAQNRHKSHKKIHPRHKRPKTSESSGESGKDHQPKPDKDLRSFNKKRACERKILLREIEEAFAKVENLNQILDSINQTLEDHRYLSVTNDAVVAQQGYVFKIQDDLLKLHKSDLDWLVDFSNPSRLCKDEVPDHLLYQIMAIKVKFNSTQDRINKAQETISKIRELWILFEYYTVRIMLWTKALDIHSNYQTTQAWKNEAELIKHKIKRVRKIKKSLDEYISEVSKSIINKLWEETERSFQSHLEKL